MTKNELIEKLQSVKGNPMILLSDAELGFIELKVARLEKCISQMTRKIM